jgi:hypothetical protein
MNALKSPAAFWSAVGVTLAVALALVFLKLEPASTALAAAANEAEENVAAARRAGETVAGTAYLTGVEAFVADRSAKAEKFRADRAAAAAKLSDWFDGMSMPDDADRPSRQLFQRSYAFHRDRLFNSVQDLIRRSGGPDVHETPLIKPPFLGGPPPEDEELPKWQRIANLERSLLEWAARTGAFATKPLEIEALPPPLSDPDPSVARFGVRGTFAAPTRKLGQLVFALLQRPAEAGAVARLEGYSIEPGAIDWPAAENDDPPMAITVNLTMTHPLPKPAGAPR